mgnify:FL=1
MNQQQSKQVMRKHLSVLFLALLVSGGYFTAASAPPERLRLSLIPLANPAVEPAAVDRFNRTMNAALAWLPRQTGVELVPADTLAALLDGAIKPDFPELYEPFSLARANLELQLDGVLFCRLERRAGRIVITARAMEFPSGVLAAENEQPLPADTVTVESPLLTSLIQRFAVRDSLTGHPFGAGEQGLVLLTGDLTQEEYRSACQQFFAALQFDESQQPLRVKILSREKLLPQAQEICGVARDLKAATQAAWLFDLRPAPDGARVRFAQALTAPPQKPVMEWTLPVFPQVDELACVELPADSTAAHEINAALLEAPPDPLAVVTQEAWNATPALAFRAALRLHQGLAGTGTSPSPARMAAGETLYRLAADGAASKPLEAWSALYLGTLLAQENKSAEAITALQEAEALFGPMADPSGLILSRRELAAVYTGQQAWQQARQTLNRLLNIPPDSLTQALTWQKVAQLYEKEGRTNESVQAYHRTAKINLAIKRPYEAAMVYQRLGQIMRETGDLDRSVAYLDTFLTQSQSLASEPALARAYFQMGLTRLARNEREIALSNFLKAGDYLEMLGDHSGQARADLNIGAIYWQLGDTLKARQRYFSAINQATAEGDSVMVLMSAVNLADIHLTQKNYSQAQTFFDRALAIAQQARDAREQAKITYAKGLAYLKEGRLRAGYARIKEAMALGGGSVNGDAAKEQAFLDKLSLLIGDIETLRGAPPPRY